MDRYAQVGLAFATSIGVWVNFGLLVWFAMRRGLMSFDDRLGSAVARLGLSGLAMGAALFFAAGPVARYCEIFGAFRYVTALGILAVLGAAVYGGVVGLLSGRNWWREFARRSA
jgi:putative peptidoglycan lipid II flippase